MSHSSHWSKHIHVDEEFEWCMHGVCRRLCLFETVLLFTSRPGDMYVEVYGGMCACVHCVCMGKIEGTIEIQ